MFYKSHLYTNWSNLSFAIQRYNNDSIVIIYTKRKYYCSWKFEVLTRNWKLNFSIYCIFKTHFEITNVNFNLQDFILHDDNFKYFLNNLKKKDLHKNFNGLRGRANNNGINFRKKFNFLRIINKDYHHFLK